MKANSHPAKLVFQPAQSLEFLRFVLDSILIRVTTTVARVGKILALCCFSLAKRLFTIRHEASLIGTHVSTFSGVELGPLHYRRLERDKDIALRDTLGDFEGLMSLSLEGIEDLNWWIVTLLCFCHSHPHIDPPIMEYQMLPLLQVPRSRVGVLLRGPLARMVCGLKLRQRTTLTCWNCCQWN